MSSDMQRQRGIPPRTFLQMGQELAALLPLAPGRLLPALGNRVSMRKCLLKTSSFLFLAAMASNLLAMGST